MNGEESRRTKPDNEDDNDDNDDDRLTLRHLSPSMKIEAGDILG